MKIINYGHACFQIISKDFKLLFDPYQDDSVPGLKLPKIETDYVLISHDHHDHNAINLVNPKYENGLNYEVVEVPHDKENGALRGMNKIHIVEVEGLRIAHFGDIGVLPNDLSKLMNIDIALMPINGYYTIGANEALELFSKINAKCLIPMHFFDKNSEIGYFDGNQIDILLEQIDEANFIENDEYDFTENSKGIYVFKKARN